MGRMNEVRTVAFVGDYFPRKCGIATFTQDLHPAVAERFPEVECCVVPVDDIEAQSLRSRAPQDDDLLAQHHVLSFKRRSRSE